MAKTAHPFANVKNRASFVAEAIDPRAIRIDPKYNIRFFDTTDATPEAAKRNADDIALRNSIQHTGLQVPLIVRSVDGYPVLVSGHRRLSAVLELIAAGHPINKVRVVLENENTNTNDADRTVALWTTNDGKELTQLEKAAIVARLRAYEWTDAEIGLKVGLSERSIRELWTLSKANKAVKALVAEGAIGATLAALIQSQAKEAAEAVAKEAARLAKEANKAAKEAAALAKKPEPDDAPISSENVRQAGKNVGVKMNVQFTKAELRAQKLSAERQIKEAAATAATERKLIGEVAKFPAGLSGPFTTKTRTILDGSGLEIATATTIIGAGSIAQVLTLAWNAAQRLKPVAATTEPVQPVKAETLPDASPIVPMAISAKRGSRKPMVKTATPEAEATPEAHVVAKRGRKPRHV